MDSVLIEQLVLNTWNFIVPYVKNVAGKLVQKAGESLPEVVGKIWDTVKGKMEEQTETSALPTELVTTPDDQVLQGAFQYQLKKLLENDEAFAEQLEKLIVEAKEQGTSYAAIFDGDGVIAQGRGAIAVGKGGVYISGKFSSNTIIPGDKNSINSKRRKRNDRPTRRYPKD